MAKSDAGEGGGMANLKLGSQESHLLSPEISAAGSDSGGGHVEEEEDLLRGVSFSELIEAEENCHAHAKGEQSMSSAGAAATPSSHHHHQHTSLGAPASLANPGTCSNTSATTTAASKSKSENKSDPSQTTRKPARKSNTAKKMSSTTKPPKSASRRPAPINVRIVRAVDSSPSAHPAPSSSTVSSASSQSSTTTTHKTASSSQQNGAGSAHAHDFVMNMLPMTKIRELCLHASAHARRHLGVVLDGSRLEARDRDGHVFRGHETISEETLRGETIYLIEGGLDARGPAEAARARRSSSSSSRAGSEKPRGGGGSRERGRLLCLKSLELEGEAEGEGEEKVKGGRTPYRTPSVSSRASSSQGASKGRSKSEPRMTPSQKALAIAQMGQTPATQQPLVQKRQPAPSAVKKSLPSPAMENVGECSDGDTVPGDETLVGDPDEIEDLERTLVAASPVRISTPPPSSPKQQPQRDQHQVPSNLQDSQLVIPDSQDPFSQDLFSQQSESVESQHPALTAPKPEMPDAPLAQSHPSPRVKASPTSTTTVTRRKLPTSRPDPYDINTVLSDEEDDGSDESNSNQHTVRMAPSVRKLGSATAQRRSVVPPPVSLPSPRRAQSNPASPSRANRAGASITGSKTPTPTKKAATPVKADPSSPAAPLPSSPTTHVAAAIARSGQRRERTPQLPSPGQVVYRVPTDSEEDDEIIEEAFRNMSVPDIPSPSLPWSQPPLRAGSGSEARAEKQLTPRGNSARRTAGEAREGTPRAGMAPSSRSPIKKSPLKKPPPSSPRKISGQKSPIKCSPIITSPSKKEEATVVHDSESEDARELGIVKQETGISSTNDHLKESPLRKSLPASPRKTLSQRSPIKRSPIITSPSKREEAVVIDDASSEEDENEQDILAVKKEETVDGFSPFLKKKLADIPVLDENSRQAPKTRDEVIEVSSGSEADIGYLEDIPEEDEEDEAKLPTIDADLPLQEAQVPPLPQSPARVDPRPLPESPKADPIKIEPAYEEPPPSAQASKRKRDASQEPDPEEQTHRRKRVRRNARKAKKQRNREQKAAMQVQEGREEQLAALEEQRKELALERAHRRALELEIIVSSPVKREPSIDLSEDADDDDSGVGVSPPSDDDDDEDAGRAGVLLDGDDKNDSLSSREAGDSRPSWRELSKAHLSSSQQEGSRDSYAEDGPGHLAAPPTSTPAIIEAQLQQCVEERFHRMQFDDWAFLENTLGRGLGGGHGHSPLEVHTRVHLGMMHRAQRPAIHASDKADKVESDTARDEPQQEQPEPVAPSNRAGDDVAPARARSQRSEAPSPKEQRAIEQMKRAKPCKKLRQERARKEKRARRANRRYHHDFRPSLADSRRMKQKQGRNGH